MNLAPYMDIPQWHDLGLSGADRAIMRNGPPVVGATIHLSENIVTIEDPVEFVHRHKKSIVNQREVCAKARDVNTVTARGVIGNNANRIINFFPEEKRQWLKVLAERQGSDLY